MSYNNMINFSIHRNMRKESTRIHHTIIQNRAHQLSCCLASAKKKKKRLKTRKESKQNKQMKQTLSFDFWCFNVQLKSISFPFIILALIKSLTYIHPASWELIIIIVFIVHGTGISSIWPKKDLGARESYHQQQRKII